MKEINLSSSITSTESGAFMDCKSLKRIRIPTGITSINDNSFNGCSSLIQVMIPSSVTFLGDSAFADCSSLEKLSYHLQLQIMENRFLWVANILFKYLFLLHKYQLNKKHSENVNLLNKSNLFIN